MDAKNLSLLVTDKFAEQQIKDDWEYLKELLDKWANNSPIDADLADYFGNQLLTLSRQSSSIAEII